MSTNKAAQSIQTIASLGASLVAVIETGKTLYELSLVAMDSIEAVKDNVTAKTGSQKKAWVLDFVKDRAIELGLDWDTLKESISKFIDNAKTLYNKWKEVSADFKK